MHNPVRGLGALALCALCIGCHDGEDHRAEIQKDLADAGAKQIGGTPTFNVGKQEKDTIAGVRLVGTQSYATFETAIRRLLPTTTP